MRKSETPPLGLADTTFPEADAFEAAAQLTNDTAMGDHQRTMMLLLRVQLLQLIQQLGKPGIESLAQLGGGFTARWRLLPGAVDPGTISGQLRQFGIGAPFIIAKIELAQARIETRRFRLLPPLDKVGERLTTANKIAAVEGIKAIGVQHLAQPHQSRRRFRQLQRDIALALITPFDVPLGQAVTNDHQLQAASSSHSSPPSIASSTISPFMPVKARTIVRS